MRYENTGWTPKDLERLHRMKAEGLPGSVIGYRMGKSKAAVLQKLRQLNDEHRTAEATQASAEARPAA